VFNGDQVSPDNTNHIFPSEVRCQGTMAIGIICEVIAPGTPWGGRKRE
jgi:hypothetical protein